MAIGRLLTGLTLGMSLSAFVSYAGPDENSAVIVAEVDGQKLTRVELEQRHAAKLLQARYQHYLAEREALEQLIDGQLLEMQARRDGLTVEQLLQREVISQVKDPTEDQIQVFYEGMRTEEPFELVRKKILATLSQTRLGKARTAYLQTLRSRADVRIALTPPKVDMVLDNAPRRGSQDAPVLIVEFADYECPYCQAVHPDLKKLQSEFSDKVAFAFKDFPLPMHANAQKAAEAARCAGAQGRFWDFHDLLFTKGTRLDVAQLKENARILGLNGSKFDQCLDSNEQTTAVRNDLAQAQRLGLTGTPSFFINGHFLSGAVKYSTLREIVEQQLPTPAASRSTSR